MVLVIVLAVIAALAVIGKMRLLKRDGATWIFSISAVYFIVGMWSLYAGSPTAWLPPLYIIVLSMPFWFPPLGRAINLSVDWDLKMFDFFRRKTAKEYLDEAKDNVYTLPKPKLVPPMPEVEPPKKEEPAKIFYRLGLTDNNRVAFSMGYSEITMNKEGVQQMIDQLEFFQSQLYDEGPDGSGPDGDGGEPVPVPEQKAA